MTQTKPYIISLGGSVISRADGVDIEYLKKFAEVIREEVAGGKRFVIVTGGGTICRLYQKAAEALGAPSHDDLDWIGIASTRLNAQLVRTLLSDISHPEIIEDPTQPPEVTKPVVIGSGYIPGRSSDHDAVLLAMHYGAQDIINLGSAAFVFDSDPRMHPNAKRFDSLTWSEYLTMIPVEWRPGLSTPFDPTAARDAEKAGLRVFIADGNNLEGFKNYLSTGTSAGTLIHP